ncbi:TIGR03364 family FAD-dependent oxidoreductase [Marinibaculum pumilum]|uniref:TIGR03364 family FAD-dependent oxidoreductase n=1 Tax=Marinibaculum pumilum TaxID=1766165 RepID=A0ABV7KZU9_9PROT
MKADLVIVGAGIVGLAHALAAARRGLQVVVIDRDRAANGASIRNFGFVTVTGQRAGQVHERAMRARDIWLEVVAETGLPVLQIGLLVAAHSPEAVAVLEAFRATEMGEGCALLTAEEARIHCPPLAQSGLAAALWSPHERRVEAREALPAIARWLAERHGVSFRFGCTALAAEPAGDGWRLETNAGPAEAGALAVCTGDAFQGPFADRIAGFGLTRCKLQMSRLDAATGRIPDLPCAVMSDTSLVRYDGYARLPEAAALRRRLEQEVPETLAHGVHLICVQSADGSIVVGDSHDYGDTLDPFFRREVEALYLDELRRTLELPPLLPTESWIGVYASHPDHVAIVDTPAQGARIAIVTSGTGMSTAFAIGEEVVAGLFD